MTSWPHRYEVVVRAHEGDETTYRVVTWASVQRAEELVLRRHESRTDAPGRVAAVRDLGPVSRDDRGQTVLEGQDIVDRMEW